MIIYKQYFLNGAQQLHLEYYASEQNAILSRIDKKCEDKKVPGSSIYICKWFIEKVEAIE